MNGTLCAGSLSARSSYGHQPNWRFNADANIGHAFGIFMAYVGSLRASRSGAGYLGVRPQNQP